MKTTKKMFIVCMALILATISFVPSTFSWYDHDDERIGNRMTYQRNDLPLSAGTVAIETKKYRMDGNNVYYDEKGNKEYNGGAITNGSSVGAGAAQYYGTTITNSGDAPAYVNLYLKNFTHNANNYIGTSAPNITYKNMSSSVHLANKNLIRVYFQFAEANEWKASGAKTYLVYKTKTSSSYAHKQITSQVNNSLDTGNILGGKTTYYVDLEPNTTEFFFATDANASGFNTSNCTVTQNWYRTNTITDIQAETGYWLTGIADDTTWRAQYATFNIPGGVSIKTYYNEATLSSGQRTYVTLTAGTNFTGRSVTYARQSGSTSVTVNSNTGLVTSNEGTSGSTIATIRTTVTGSLGDTAYVDTFVKNPTTIPAAPVALNVKIPGRTQNEDTHEWENGKTEVVWYIDNKSSATCSFASIYYTK